MKLWIVWFLVPIFCFAHNPKIYDCFMFFNEIDLLEWRFEELYDHVDYFVLVENIETFQGNSKPLYFQENKDRFAKYLDKIRHVVLSTPIFQQCNRNPWAVEKTQRDAIVQGLYDAQPEDIIFISDADEIIRADTIPEIVKNLSATNPILFLEMYGANFFINRTYGTWMLAYATQIEFLSKYSPDHLRTQHKEFITPTNHIQNAGWHFSSLGGHEKFVIKLESFSHMEANNESMKSYENYVRELLARKRVEVDHTFPTYIQDHLQELTAQGYVDVGQWQR